MLSIYLCIINFICIFFLSIAKLKIGLWGECYNSDHLMIIMFTFLILKIIYIFFRKSVTVQNEYINVLKMLGFFINCLSIVYFSGLTFFFFKFFIYYINGDMNNVLYHVNNIIVYYDYSYIDKINMCTTLWNNLNSLNELNLILPKDDIINIVKNKDIYTDINNSVSNLYHDRKNSYLNSIVINSVDNNSNIYNYFSFSFKDVISYITNLSYNQKVLAYLLFTGGPVIIYNIYSWVTWAYSVENRFEQNVKVLETIKSANETKILNDTNLDKKVSDEILNMKKNISELHTSSLSSNDINQKLIGEVARIDNKLINEVMKIDRSVSELRKITKDINTEAGKQINVMNDCNKSINEIKEFNNKSIKDREEFWIMNKGMNDFIKNLFTKNLVTELKYLDKISKNININDPDNLKSFINYLYDKYNGDIEKKNFTILNKDANNKIFEKKLSDETATKYNNRLFLDKYNERNETTIDKFGKK